jgi:hypothetical protein
LYAKNIYYISIFYDFCLIAVEPKKYPATTASSTVPKNDNTKGGASYSAELPPQKTKLGMLTRSHNQDNIRLLKLTIILTYTDRIVEYIEDESGKEQGEDDVEASFSLSHSRIDGIDHTKK